MKLKTTFVVLVLVALSSSAQAQQVSGFVESWNTVSEAAVTPQLNVYAQGPLKGRLGWSAWTLTSEGWSEALVGITFAPKSWIELGGSLGIETDGRPLRGGAGAFLSKGRLSLLSLHEHGGSGYWYRYLGKFQATKTIAVGVNSIRFLGTGPYVEAKLGRVSLWGTYAIGNDKGVAGVRLNF